MAPIIHHHPSSLDDLARAIAVEGIGAHTPELSGVAGAARQAGISPVLVEVLLDEHAPAVARERAFGMIATQLWSGAAAPAAIRSAA
jgi:hypothetical protein